MGYLNWFSSRDSRKLDQIIGMLQVLQKGEDKMAFDITALVAEVAQVKTVQASAVLALQTLSQEVKDTAASATDLVQLKADLADLTSQLDASTQPLAAAVANVPVGPPLISGLPPAPTS